MTVLGPFGTTVPPPPNVGSVVVWLPDNQPNRGSSSCVQAWYFFKQLMGTIVPNAWNDLNNLPNE